MGWAVGGTVKFTVSAITTTDETSDTYFVVDIERRGSAADEAMTQTSD